MSNDNVRIMCPKLTCRRVLAVPSSARGKVVRCRNCGTNIKVPQAGGPASGPANPSEGKSEKKVA